MKVTSSAICRATHGQKDANGDVYYDPLEMRNTVGEAFAYLVTTLHDKTMKRGEPLTLDQLNWRPPATGREILKSAAWNLWHIARWHEITAGRCANMTKRLADALTEDQEIWRSEDMKAKWGFDGMDLGNEESGFEQPRDKAAEMQFPSKEDLIDYVSRSVGRSVGRPRRVGVPRYPRR